MRKLELLILFLLIAGSLSAQKHQTIDSLRSILTKAGTADSIRLLLEVGWEYRLSYPDSTHIYCAEALRLERQRGEGRLIPRAYNFRGIASVYQGEYAEAYGYHQKALEHARARRDSAQIAHAFNSLGRLFSLQGDQLRSYEYYHKALRIFEQINDLPGISYCYKSLARLYLLQSEYTKAEDKLHSALTIRQQIGDDRGIVSVYLELAELQQQQAAHEQAMAYLQRARAICEAAQDNVSMAEIDMKMAESYLQQRKFRKGLVTALMALATAQDMQNLSLYHSIQLLLGRIYLEKGNPDAAEGYLKDVVTFAENNASVARLSKAHELLAVLYARRDDYQKAYQHQGLFMHYKSQLFNAEKAKIMERMETRLLIEQKEHAYQLLQASSLQQEENLAFELNKNYAETAIIVLALLLAATLGISYRKSRKLAGRLYSQKKHIEAQHDEISQQNLRIREQNDLLEQQNQELAELNREKDTIMSMVAHDLKSPLNRLNGLSELLIMARQEPQEQEKYASLIKETSQEGVSLVHELLDQKIGQQNPLAGMQAIDLSQLLRQIGLQHQDAALAKRIRLLIECPDGLSLWTDRKALKRIIDNLLSNAIKYSFTDTVVELKGKQLGDDIEIIIADQGPGFTEEDKANLYQQYQQLSAKPTRGESSHGLGLSIVKNLVDKMQGRLLLESEAGIGSTFRVILSQQA